MTPELSLVRRYVEPFFDEAPRLHARFGEQGLVSLLQVGYPNVAERSTIDCAEQLLGSAVLDPVTRRNITNSTYGLSLAVVSRSRFAIAR